MTVITESGIDIHLSNHHYRICLGNYESTKIYLKNFYDITTLEAYEKAQGEKFHLTKLEGFYYLEIIDQPS